MSVCLFLAADCAMQEVHPTKEYPLEINVDTGVIYDGNADDNYHLYLFPDVDRYTTKAYGMQLEWAYYTEGRALKLIEYIRDLLKQTECVELWQVWLGDDEAKVKTISVTSAELKPEDIQMVDQHELWKKPTYLCDSPTYFCLRISR